MNPVFVPAPASLAMNKSPAHTPHGVTQPGDEPFIPTAARSTCINSPTRRPSDGAPPVDPSLARSPPLVRVFHPLSTNSPNATPHVSRPGVGTSAPAPVPRAVVRPTDPLPGFCQSTRLWRETDAQADPSAGPVRADVPLIEDPAASRELATTQVYWPAVAASAHSSMTCRPTFPARVVPDPTDLPQIVLPAVRPSHVAAQADAFLQSSSCAYFHRSDVYRRASVWTEHRPRSVPSDKMVKGCQWTEGEGLGIAKEWIARSNWADDETSLNSAQLFEGFRIDIIAERTNGPETINDPRHWEARSVAAVRTRWFGHIAPKCKHLSACLASTARPYHISMTTKDLTDMAIAAFNQQDDD